MKIEGAKKVICFSRVSSREQEETGYSLPSQEKLLADYANKNGFVVAKKFSISESASGQKQRKTFNEMLAYIGKSNVRIIICEKVDRLTRNLKDAVSINEWINGKLEREVHFVKENCVLNKESRSNEKFIWNIKVSVAQYYIDNLSEEVKKGQKEKIAQGWLPTKPPLGYKTVGEKGHKIHIINEDKALLVKEMFNLYASGNYSLKSLTEKINQEGLRGHNDNKVSKSRLHKLLSDPFYYGKIRWKEEVYDGNQEPLITKTLFDQVQEILRGKTTPKYNKHFYLFKGLIDCLECEGKITWEKQKGIIYGHCNHYRNCSQKIWVKDHQVEEQLLKYFDSFQIKSPRLLEWIRRALKESNKDESEYHLTALKNLNQRYEQLKRRLDRLYDDRLDEKINEEFYKRKFKQYSEEKDKIVQAIEEHSQASTKHQAACIDIYDLSQRARETYLKANQDQKRHLIGMMFEKLTLDNGLVAVKFMPAFELLSHAVVFSNSSKVLKMVGKSADIFEPAKDAFKQRKNKALDPVRSELLRR